ncbi:Hypothetical predicted protein [Pelobates cultripes]|uniref:Uncharacterized protein n=1 Tax=Pelobates cultripes TaxID=61616 RepID=A0AAD1R0X9_PELCU|nr:Hypothetical predicted protein [Pelobates cultripes]
MPVVASLSPDRYSREFSPAVAPRHAASQQPQVLLGPFPNVHRLLLLSLEEGLKIPAMVLYPRAWTTGGYVNLLGSPPRRGRQTREDYAINADIIGGVRRSSQLLQYRWHRISNLCRNSASQLLRFS